MSEQAMQSPRQRSESLISVSSAPDPAADWEVALPSPAEAIPGITMAGFRARAEDWVETRLVPYPALTLVIDLGEELVVDDAVGQSKRGSVAVGIAPRSVHGSGRSIQCLQVRFTPVAAYGLFGDAVALSGSVIALDDLWGRGAAGLEEQLSTSQSWNDRFAIVTAALRRRRETQRTVDPEIAFAWHQLTTSRGLVRIATLSSELGWSRKRLWSRFKSQVGLSPKRAAELVRFDHAAHCLAAGESPAMVAAVCGYVDQSHLHREIRAFAGLTPSAIAKAPWLAVDEIAWASEAEPCRSVSDRERSSYPLGLYGQERQSGQLHASSGRPRHG